MENAIVLTFRGSDRARASLGALRRLHATGEIRLHAVAIVERTSTGRAVVVDQAEDIQITATATGGAIGGIVGALGGPAGLVVGGATGAAIGSLIHIAKVESADEIVRTLGSAVPLGHTATIAVVDEPVAAPVDALASQLGILPLRRPRVEVESEIADAKEAAISGQHDESKRTIGDQVRGTTKGVIDRP
jgi:uncharacterized membrane protein